MSLEITGLPAQLRVLRIRRPKYGCRACGTIRQEPAPDRPIAKGLARPALLPHVLIPKYCDHLPLYRQSQILARQGVTPNRSTLANQLVPDPGPDWRSCGGRGTGLSETLKTTKSPATPATICSMRGDGDDTLIGSDGSDTISGGNGTDVAVFSGLFSDYLIEGSENSVSVTSLDRLCQPQPVRRAFSDLDITYADGNATVTFLGDSIVLVGAEALDPAMLCHSRRIAK